GAAIVDDENLEPRFHQLEECLAPSAARAAESHDERDRFAVAANLVAKLEAVFGLGEIANCCHCESPLDRILVMNTNYGRERFKRLRDRPLRPPGSSRGFDRP